jgi:hypothetical protein
MAKKRKKPDPAEQPDDEAPGWHAIDAACERLYPDPPDPLHVASAPHPPFGDGLIYGISAYRAAGPDHWHLVTYGFSELYAKESDDPAVSGWGFELTFRLTRGREKRPPGWAFSFLMNLGRYVRRSGNPFGEGHAMDLNGPIAVGTDTAVRAAAFAADPQLGAVDTPNGRVEFLQVVGLTADEHEACGDWSTGGVLDVLRAANPLLVTDLGHRSVLDDPVTGTRVREGIERDGSQSDRSFVAVAEWTAGGRGRNRAAAVALGAKAVRALLGKFRSRLAHGRDFVLAGREQAVRFRPAAEAGWERDGAELVVNLSAAALAAVRGSLKAARGRYAWPELPGLTVEVRPTEITDAAGNVAEVIG